MGLRIGTNVQSLAAQRQLGINVNDQKKSIEKLASGTRIVRSGDDAAGLAISEQSRANIRSIRQATRNANDGISVVQVAEGGLNEIGNILTRFRELSIQAASDTIGDAERSYIDKEVQQLNIEIERIAGSTEFNGRPLLNGEGDAIEIQVGIHNDASRDRITYETGTINATPGTLGVDGLSVSDKASAQDNLDKIDEAIKVLNSNRAELGALQNRMQSTVQNAMIFEENMSAARSRIYDVDMASETAELSKANILAQASTAVLSQANQNGMLALKLL